MRGKRVLILLDRSASMLHQDLVNVIVLRNSDDDRTSATPRSGGARSTRRTGSSRSCRPTRSSRSTASTRRRKSVVAGTQRQVAGRERSRRPHPEHRSARRHRAAGWHQPHQRVRRREADEPAAGSDHPDHRRPADAGQDGGRSQVHQRGRSRRSVRRGDRKSLPQGVPVDVVLLPMKGEVPAAHQFWQLTRATRGTLLMPSKDWP